MRITKNNLIAKTKNGYSVIRILSGRSNVFIISNGKTNILIDTSPKFMRKRLLKNLVKSGVGTIDYIFLTHSHFDHSANASYLKSKFHAKVIINENEAEVLESGKNILPKGTNTFVNILISIFGELLLRFFGYEPCKADIFTGEKFDLRDIGFNAYLMHTPGHSPGSSCLIADDEIAIAGDAVFGVFSGSAMPPFASDKDELIASWRKLLQTGCYLFLPSHGKGVSKDVLRRDYIRNTKGRPTF